MLRQSHRMIAILATSGVVSAVAVGAAAALVSHRGAWPRLGLLMDLLALVVIFQWCALVWVATWRLPYDERGFRIRRFLRGWTKVDWSDVSLVQRSSSRPGRKSEGLRITYGSARNVVGIPLDSDGFRKFAVTVGKCVPLEKISEETRSLVQEDVTA
jgi:hypothetical protein